MGGPKKGRFYGLGSEEQTRELGVNASSASGSCTGPYCSTQRPQHDPDQSSISSFSREQIEFMMNTLVSAFHHYENNIREFNQSQGVSIPPPFDWAVILPPEVRTPHPPLGHTPPPECRDDMDDNDDVDVNEWYI